MLHQPLRLKLLLGRTTIISSQAVVAHLKPIDSKSWEFLKFPANNRETLGEATSNNSSHTTRQISLDRAAVRLPLWSVTPLTILPIKVATNNIRLLNSLTVIQAEETSEESKVSTSNSSKSLQTRRRPQVSKVLKAQPLLSSNRLQV